MRKNHILLLTVMMAAAVLLTACAQKQPSEEHETEPEKPVAAVEASETVPSGSVSIEEQPAVEEPAEPLPVYVNIFGTDYTEDTEVLSFPELEPGEAELRELSGAMDRLPLLQVLELGRPTVPDAEMFRFCDEHPEVDVHWTTELFGTEFSTSNEVLTWDRVPMTLEDTAVIESYVPYMHSLKMVELLECGISNTDMEALNNRYEDIRFVWIVQIFNTGIRTDTTYYCQYNCPIYYSHNNQNCQALYYCHDLVAIDIGHHHDYAYLKEDGTVNDPAKRFSTEFLLGTPHLKYLCVADCQSETIPELASLKELVFLEIYWGPFHDLTPLLECPNFQHLNMANTGMKNEAGVQANMDALCRMKNLKRLWISWNFANGGRLEALQEALPDTQIFIVPGTDCVAGGWRDGDQVFFDYRDALHMYYITDKSDSVDINPYTGELSQYLDTNPFKKNYAYGIVNR